MDHFMPRETFSQEEALNSRQADGTVLLVSHDPWASESQALPPRLLHLRGFLQALPTGLTTAQVGLGPVVGGHLPVSAPPISLDKHTSACCLRGLSLSLPLVPGRAVWSQTRASPGF